MTTDTLTKNAPKAWQNPEVDNLICDNTLYLPIAHNDIKRIPIKENDEEMIDIIDMNNKRLVPLSKFSSQYNNTYKEFSLIRKTVADKLLKMLEFLPVELGIAYFEGFRPIYKQKQYFDDKMRETLETIKDKELAYEETSKSVLPPFDGNTPTHATGAAIDMTLFSFKNGLLDMGKFDTIFGPNHHQETFSTDTTQAQRKNRLILLEAAIKAGFVNYGFEWWHYSYGDKAWAYVKNQKEAIYDIAADKNDPILSIKKSDYLDTFDVT
ncbi:M15 family metallopeptidase [Candidatus Phycorickettsia trachydisci]|nr:M15 family metallopeptidase [Candidatus Phycorickettsia trachydisci]